MVSAKSGFADRNGASLGMPGPIYTWDGAVSSEQVIPANTPIAFHYLGLPQYGRQCFNTMTFIPEPGMDYMVRASMSGSCSFELAELPKGAERWSPIEPTPSGRLSMCHAMYNFSRYKRNGGRGIAIQLKKNPHTKTPIIADRRFR